MQQQVIKQQYLTLGLDRDVINTTLNRWNNHVSPSVWVQHYFLLFVSFVLKKHSTEMMNSRWRGVTFMMTACYVFIATTFQPLKTPHTLASVQSSDFMQNWNVGAVMNYTFCLQENCQEPF